MNLLLFCQNAVTLKWIIVYVRTHESPSYTTETLILSLYLAVEFIHSSFLKP